MAKRFTDNELWKKQRWFKKLSVEYKLAFFYIKDQCTHWGVWEVDCIDLMEDTGIEHFDLIKFIESVNTEYDKITGDKINKNRIIQFKKNSLWITGFLQFQWENKVSKLNPAVPAVRTALTTLQGLGILNEALDNSYITLIEGYDKKDDLLEFLNNGWKTIRERNRVSVDNSILNAKNEKNGKPVNFAAQGADFLVERVAKGKVRLNRTGTENNREQGE